MTEKLAEKIAETAQKKVQKKAQVPSILLGQSDEPVTLELNMANRHGLIAGATGTGKTVTLKILAEGFSRQGVPVLLTDIKGDLSGTVLPGTPHPEVDRRVQTLNISDFEFSGFPVVFWDVYGQQGHPVRTTVSELGPLLLSRLLGLNENQEGLLSVLFKLADDHGYLLLDLKDLKAMLTFVQEERAALAKDYGHISPASLGAIQRKVLALETQDITSLLGEPALQLFDLMKTNAQGYGHINILSAETLMVQPALYAATLLWLLSELFETLPEVGDVDRPKLVLFFDEAHLLFDDMPEILLDKMTQVVRLIRSKGVGVFFITQNPLDIPEGVRGQLGNRIQHAMRVFSAKDRKALKALADSFPENVEKGLDFQEVIPQLGTGEALVSTLNGKGFPSPGYQTLMAPPRSQFGPISSTEREQILKQSLFYGHYDTVVDRDSAHELLQRRRAQEEAEADLESPRSKKNSTRRSARQSPLEAFFKSTVRAIGSQLGRQIARGLLGSIRR